MLYYKLFSDLFSNKFFKIFIFICILFNICRLGKFYNIYVGKN